ncbi:MEKHLA domain-containing protein [Methylohalobius crimeensis]|uniref:MEKHLA domain-containing protein n=1 Tax=Methylohalobius crimeensis TaxID=244365 RepID=UPI0003B4B8D3|nr:MEKHLA domain-containing protein [Methylohalobius crimeensis]
MSLEPSPANDFLAEHIQRLTSSYHRLTGRDLVEPKLDPIAAARWLYRDAPFALLSHDTRDDPVFNYANLTAQGLFEMNWGQFTRLPSRLSAEPLAQAERRRLLEEVSAKGYIDDYSGVRIARSGKRFRIEGSTVWNVYDENDAFYGQAARIEHWQTVSDDR